MKALKMFVLLTVAAMTYPSCYGASEYNCDGGIINLCHENQAYHTHPGSYTYYDSDGDSEVWTCTSSIENQGNCNPTGVHTCNWTTTWVDDDGIQHSTAHSSTFTNYTCTS
jgi:hypothetical protein